MNTVELRKDCSAKLKAGAGRCGQLNAFLGFDGFVDSIIHPVSKRESADKFESIPTIGKFAERIAGAAGKSTNIELVTRLVKLGGNGPIMANALAWLGLKVSYLGSLGHPELHSAFAEFAKRAEVHSILGPGLTDALEFEDGKIMLGKHELLNQFTWDLIGARFGHDKFQGKVAGADFVAMVNWTMYTGMNEIWSCMLKDVCPKLTGSRRKIFFDLADPEKRSREDIVAALKLISEFEKYFDVILGLNEKESSEVGDALRLDTSDHSPEGLAALGRQIQERMPVNTIVIHPVSYALAVSRGDTAIVEGPFTPKPLITTGAGDHFNAGFCLGKLLGLDNAKSVLTGVASSGYYVRTAKSPTMDNLVQMMNDWPVK
jgi:ketohexokinase